MMFTFTRHIVSAVWLSLCLTPVCAQKFTVEVFNFDNGKILPNAFVNIYKDTSENPIVSMLTDDNGRATFYNIVCPCRVEVVAIGYEPSQQSITGVDTHLYTIGITKKFASLDEVMVTGTLQPVKTQNALSTFRVITSEMMQAQGSVTLSDALRTQLNMNVSNDNILGAGIRMQGMNGDKVKILIDGMPVNGREGGNIDMGQLNLYNVDHIEIVQGPLSVIYGSDALGGVINLITRDQMKKRELTANGYYETVGKYNFNLNSSHRILKRHYLTLGGGRNYFDGWKYTDTAEPHRQMRFKPKEQYMGNLAYSYNAPSGFRIRFASDFLKEKVTNKGAAKINAFEGRALDDYYGTVRSINRLSLQGKLFKKLSWQSQNSYALYHHTKNSYIKDLVTLSQKESTETGAQDTSRFTEIASRSTVSGSIKHFSYTAGYDIDIQHGLSQRISRDVKNISDYAGLAILSYSLWKDRLTLHAGARASHNTQYRTPFIPSGGILLKPDEKWQIRASYAQGFRAPTLKEMYLEFIDQNHHITGNVNLKPESGQHMQASVSYQVYGKKTEYLQLILTGYYNDVYDGIVLLNLFPDDPNNIKYTYGNLAREKNTIANVQAEGQWRNLHYILGYAYSHTFGQEGLYGAFTNTEATANLQYYFKKAKFSCNLFYKYNGKQPFLRTSIDGSISYSGRQPDYHMMDASLEKKFFDKRVQLICGVKNIMNIQTLSGSGVNTGGAHGGSSSVSFLPRSFFTSMRVTLQ